MRPINLILVLRPIKTFELWVFLAGREISLDGQLGVKSETVFLFLLFVVSEGAEMIIEACLLLMEVLECTPEKIEEKRGA